MRKLITAFIITISAIGAATFVAPKQTNAAVKSCSEYAIMRCGAADPKDFIRKLKQPEETQLRKLYAAYGLAANEYSRFAKEAKVGMVEPGTNNITYKGKKVSAVVNGISPKRSATFNDKTKVKIGDRYYWRGDFTKTQGGDRVPAFILFDKYGNLEFIVLKTTGAPQWALPNNVKTNSECTSVKATPVAGKPNTYNFTATVYIAPGSELVDVNYHFADGSRVQKKRLNAPVQRTFTENSRVEVYIGIRKPSDMVFSYAPTKACKLNIKCKKPRTAAPKPRSTAPTQTTQPQAVAAPAPAVATTPAPASAVQPTGGTCEELKTTILDKTQRRHQVETIAAPASGWQLASADVNFGNGVIVKGAQAVNNKVTVSHDYAKAGEYTVMATVHFVRQADRAKASADCQTNVTVEDVALVKGEEPEELISVGTGTEVFAVAGSLATIAGGARYAIRRRLGL